MTAAEEIWGDFPSTVLEFRPREPAGAALVLDVRHGVGAADRERLGDLGLTGPFAVLTAQDPLGVTQSPARNRALASRLRAEVDRLGLPYAVVDACSPDHSHCEESVAIVIARESAVALADRYAQLAIFWFDGAAFWIVPVRSSKAAVRLDSAAGQRDDATP